MNIRALFFLPAALLVAGCQDGSDKSAPPVAANTSITGVGNYTGSKVEMISAQVPVTATQPPQTTGQAIGVAGIESQMQSLVSLSQVLEQPLGSTAVNMGQNLGQFFAPQCQVVFAPGNYPLQTQGGVSAAISDFVGPIQLAKFELKKKYTKVSPDRQHGRSIILVKANLTYMTQVVVSEGWYSTDWIPVQGNWLIQGVTPIDVAKDSKQVDNEPWVFFEPYWGPGWGYY